MPGTHLLPPGLGEALAQVRSVGVITGAGISAESGIPTYRGKGGIYDDPVEGSRTVEALSGHTFLVDPDRTWRTVARLIERARGAQPGSAHRALARIEDLVERFVLLTQNVDRLHRRAGSRNLIDIHGDVFRTLCTSCGRKDELDAAEPLDRAPRCPDCRGILRPHVVLFGEMLPPEKLHRIQREFYLSVPDLVLVVGTSALFPYIADPVHHASYNGRLTVEVNPEPTDLSAHVDHALLGRAGDILPAIEAALRHR